MHDDVLIDGIAASPACLDERALQFGDGLFETIAVVDGAPCLWDRHMARLAEGCRRLNLPLPQFDVLASECRDLCAGRARAVLKLYWTAGISTRGYRRPSPLQPRRMLRVSEWPSSGSVDPWKVRECRHRLSDNPGLAQIKHLNRLDQVIARAEWDEPDIAEGVMLGQDGRVVSGTMSNIFLQRGGDLLTPVVAGAGIAGVVRQLALHLAERRDLVVHEARVTPDELHAADVLYLTNSLIGVVRVGRLESTSYDLARAEHPLMIETRRRCHEPARADSGDE